ncbi:MAG TPA: oligosaccharide flippase family protein [Rhodothermales bacterium]|nr:oligosaccharide flippase family protein [Rhodothermales bacterium]
MIPKRRLLVNASAGLIQVLVVGITFLIVYRFVKDELGIELFGVWALVLATVSVNNIANLGIASATVRFVPLYLARGMTPDAVRVIETSVISLAVFLGVILPIAYPLLIFVVDRVIEPHLYPIALAILPYAVGSFWLNAVSVVLQGCVDGYQRIDLRSLLVSGAALVYLPLVFWLVKSNGLVGLAQAQLAQAALLLIATWVTLKKMEPSLPVLPYRWNYQTFKETLGYSITFQGISVTKLLFEPVTKVLLAKFAGASTLGYFEFAHRMVFQIRSLIVTAYQAVVPTIADLQERRPDLIRDIYTESLRLLMYIVGPALGFFILLSPLVSRLWIGTIVPDFVLFSGLVFVGWFLNVLSAPAYFSNAGTGRLRWNFLGHLLTGVINVVLGIVLGYYFGAIGVVAAFSIALVVGSFATAGPYHAENHIPLSPFFDQPTVALLLTCAGAFVAGALAFVLFGEVALVHWAVPILFVTASARLTWTHPQRAKLFSALRSVVLPNDHADVNAASLDDR